MNKMTKVSLSALALSLSISASNTWAAQCSVSPQGGTPTASHYRVTGSLAAGETFVNWMFIGGYVLSGSIHSISPVVVSYSPGWNPNFAMIVRDGNGATKHISCQ